jgi:hydrogenase expression/formation protein HypD
MKYVDEFRDPEKAQFLLKEIRALVPQIQKGRTSPIYIMEVCGGHTHAIFRYGVPAARFACCLWDALTTAWR